MLSTGISDNLLTGTFLYKVQFKLLVYNFDGEVAEPVEGSRLLSGCGDKTSPRVRIPASPPLRCSDKLRVGSEGYKEGFKID